MNDSASHNKDELIQQLKQAKEKVAQLEATLAIDNKTQSALSKFDIRFQSIIDASPVPSALNDDDHNIVYLNPSFTQTFGYDITDIPTLEDWWPNTLDRA